MFSLIFLACSDIFLQTQELTWGHQTSPSVLFIACSTQMNGSPRNDMQRFIKRICPLGTCRQPSRKTISSCLPVPCYTMCNNYCTEMVCIIISYGKKINSFLSFLFFRWVFILLLFKGSLSILPTPTPWIQPWAASPHKYPLMQDLQCWAGDVLSSVKLDEKQE